MDKKFSRFELIDLPSSKDLVPDPWLDPWMVAVLSLMVMGAIAYFLLHKRKQTASDPLSLRRTPYQEAALALENIEFADARTAAVQTSLILRRYLSVVAADPALFETHEETLSRPEALVKFSAEARVTAARGFNHLASLKYSPILPVVSVSDVVTESRALLEALHQGFQA